MDSGQKRLGFRSIRNRILIFSVLVTLVPSLGMGWFWFDMICKATIEKVEQKLIDSAGIAEHEIDLWLEERSHDLRVFANSFTVLDNIGKYYAAGDPEEKDFEKRRLANLHAVGTYLTLIQLQFNDYHRFMVLDKTGLILAASDSSDRDRPVAVPEDWQDRVQAGRFFAGDVQFAGQDAAPVMSMGIPLFSRDNSSHLGFFIMEVELRDLWPLLTSSLPNGDAARRMIGLFTGDGQPIRSSAQSGELSGKSVSSQQIGQLRQTPRKLREIVNGHGERLFGLVSPVGDLSWQVAITESYDDVFAGVMQARNQIILITIFLTIAIGGTATLVAGQIIIPLKALMNGVLQVGDGDLDVVLPIHRVDELGIVSGMFNEMVLQLKEGQAKLELLATTDSLTGLANRKQIMADLTVHLEQYRRYGTEFSVLMIDIDYFKWVNDSYGHLAGDAVLVRLAQIFRETLRGLDSAGRYGGEEFLVVLGNSDLHQALQTAERIRQEVDQHDFVCDNVSLRATISIGVAAIQPEDHSGSTAELIGRADKALYEAKAGGRNRVVSGEPSPEPPLSIPALNA